MATSIFIYSNQELREPRGGLEDDLDALIIGSGEVTGGVLERTAGTSTCSSRIRWTMSTGLIGWPFLRNWGVPGDTYFEIVPDQAEPRRFEGLANRI